MNRIGQLETSYVLEVLRSQFSTSSGSKFSSKLEKAFSSLYDDYNSISFINGTATMHAVLEALNIGPGDEVIVPPLTMSATTFAVLQCNATPIFADVDPDTFLIDTASISRLITAQTKAIITVALYGLSPDMDPIVELAESKSIFVLEDNAECFLGYYKDRLVGTLGHASSFSFQSSKHLTSGEGGLVLTRDLDLADKVRRVQSLGYAGVSAKTSKISKSDIQSPSYSRHLTMGWNYRMPELCAAVALAQVERIKELVSIRIQSAQLLLDVITRFPHILQPQFTPLIALTLTGLWL